MTVCEREGKRESTRVCMACACIYVQVGLHGKCKMDQIRTSKEHISFSSMQNHADDTQPVCKKLSIVFQACTCDEQREKTRRKRAKVLVQPKEGVDKGEWREKEQETRSYCNCMRDILRV